MAAELVARDASLWLSKSWTTRERRRGEPQDAYTFVDPKTFEDHRDAGGFLEWADFMGHLYGTPVPDCPPGKDLVLEIDLQGAQQVRALYPESVVILLLPPSVEAQAQRIRDRGDDEEEVTRRISKGVEEERTGRALTPHVVVNDDLEKAVAQVAGIVDAHRKRAGA